MFEQLCDKVIKLDDKLKIGIVGKYIANNDSYVSLQKAIEHACHFYNKKPEIIMIDSETLE